MADARSTIWLDANGGTQITLIYSAAGAAAILPLMLAISHADYTRYWESAQSLNLAPAPTTGQYQTCSPDAVLTFQCADGSIARLVLPAPQIGIFLADQETVDPANAGVIALVAACIGSLASSTGSPAATYLGGTLAPSTRG